MRSLSLIAKVAVIAGAILGAAAPSSRAAFVYTYDFPGTPGSGAAANQTNSQPGNATFGDWGRVAVTEVATSGVFESAFWNNTSTFDPTTAYVFFAITAAAGYHLNLDLMTFDNMRSAGGPTKGRVVMFLNGSTTAYDSFDWNPSASIQNKTFAFTPTTDPMNVTSAEFRFYGWNGGTPAASLLFDNVAVTVTAVPEPANWIAMALPLALIAMRWANVRTRRGTMSQPLSATRCRIR